MKHLTLGIDLGTTKTAVVLFDPASPGRSRAVSTAHNASIPGSPETVRQNYSVMEESVFRLLGELPEAELACVRAVGLTGQMHSAVLWNGETVSPVTTWQDKSASAAGHLDEFRRLSGRPLCDGFGAVTLAEAALRGELVSWRCCGSPADLLAARLTGSGKPVMDPTFAASWGIYDSDTGNWDEAAASALGIPLTLLPEIIPSGSIAGYTKDVPGLADGIPVAVPFGDNQASILGTAEEFDSEIFLTIGTGAQLSYTVDRGTPPPESAELRPFLDGRMLAVTAPLCGGRAWAWLGNSVNRMLAELGFPPLPEKELLDRLDAMALSAGAGGGLSVAPHFLGERSDPALRGSIDGITLDNFSLANLAGALGTGIIRTLSAGIPDEFRRDRKRIIGSGNGLRLCRSIQLAAEREFRLPLEFRDIREEAATGAATLARKTC